VALKCPYLINSKRPTFTKFCATKWSEMMKKCDYFSILVLNLTTDTYALFEQWVAAYGGWGVRLVQDMPKTEHFFYTPYRCNLWDKLNWTMIFSKIFGQLIWSFYVAITNIVPNTHTYTDSATWTTKWPVNITVLRCLAIARAGYHHSALTVDLS